MFRIFRESGVGDQQAGYHDGAGAALNQMRMEFPHFFHLSSGEESLEGRTYGCVRALLSVL